MDMHVQVLSSHSPTQNIMPGFPRVPQVIIPPSGETDISMEDPSIIQQLKKEVREMLVVIADNPSEQLKLIDDIQRLGVSYQFESEIDAALQHIHDKYHEGDCTDDLYTLKLVVRALRFLLFSKVQQQV
ncbi:hypothetical protein RJ640_014234 [Escallonia rubra]|uniref:Terpene synthase N-terminal domain-containing protein n=1 Tax=Escallonia rubra TaxID=112253 RepID=A0AA88UB08_9ASTE|nr:hypothetical protein RJ640_014234 [Escallonia rubra]